MSTKPVVHYLREESHFVAVGERAQVYTLDHPRIGEGNVMTSTVQSYDPETGVFETLNTIYEPDGKP